MSGHRISVGDFAYRPPSFAEGLAWEQDGPDVWANCHDPEYMVMLLDERSARKAAIACVRVMMDGLEAGMRWVPAARELLSTADRYANCDALLHAVYALFEEQFPEETQGKRRREILVAVFAVFQVTRPNWCLAISSCVDMLSGTLRTRTRVARKVMCDVIRSVATCPTLADLVGRTNQ